ncbi:DNA ligase [Candidatus Dependentiae bacterium]|nr:DNA ligase [Candidatus Dependentiae bacterium]
MSFKLKSGIVYSHLDKILFPESHISKLSIIKYYQRVAPLLLFFIKNRPMVMRRFPDGISSNGFYQKQISDFFPKWIKHLSVDLKKGNKQDLVIINNQRSLLYLANLATIEFHAWLSLAQSVTTPDKIVFDLDPDNNSTKQLCIIAFALKKIIEQHDLVPFVMTTGSRGYHVVIPIVPNHSFEEIHDFAHYIAQQVEELYPHMCTIKASKKERKSKIFIDYLRNSYGQTSITPYSLRARPRATIATPLSWEELKKTAPDKYSIGTIFQRLSKKQDPWKFFFKSAKLVKL